MGADTSGDIGSILGVWAHPDDEAYLSAGLMAHAVDAGRRVVCVTATSGEAGFPQDDPRSVDERKALRQDELAACLDVLGVTEHRYLGFADGGCAAVPDEQAVTVLAELISELRPTTVLTSARTAAPATPITSPRADGRPWPSIGWPSRARGCSTTRPGSGRNASWPASTPARS